MTGWLLAPMFGMLGDTRTGFPKRNGNPWVTGANGRPSFVMSFCKYNSVASFISQAQRGEERYAGSTRENTVARSLKPIEFAPVSVPPVSSEEPVAITGLTPAPESC